jgi:phosphoribosyl-ATP pyrophosphohydrolase/phosphoribosyl-AMP cyclohydrolase
MKLAAQNISSIDFSKDNGRVTAVVQNAKTGQVLMVGYQTREAVEKTFSTQKITFYSRSKQRLWTKGETSGNYLSLLEASLDCDQDAIVYQAQPAGETCHTGSYSCFGKRENRGFLYELESTIASRIQGRDTESYTYKTHERGIEKVAQKVGEEAVEVVIEAMGKDTKKLLEESADLMYHFLLLLQSKKVNLKQVESVLLERAQKPKIA